jgi:hypothetical protein
VVVKKKKGKENKRWEILVMRLLVAAWWGRHVVAVDWRASIQGKPSPS